MINNYVFLSRINKNKCLKKNIDISSDEYIISKKEFPDLYKNIYNENEHTYIKNILSHIHKNTQYVLKFTDSNLEKIRYFFNLLFKVPEDKYINEREVHMYIYLFWDKLLWESNPLPSIQKDNLFYEGQVKNKSNKFQSNLLPHISNNCDLIYYNDNKDNGIIDFIEIKNVALDDRAISQIQRYYRKSNLKCETLNHKLNIQKLRPTLILKQDTLDRNKTNSTSLIEYWLTFPTYFREILDIYTFSFSEENKTLKMINLKYKIKSRIKEEMQVI